ncbi:amidohydrolase [Prauserella flavalba]|uniref:amidohydrolase n=1 Tax=Prauserella flavalba TaxID=1477506 RepID=UPI0011B4471B|nr:amidohydrolase [Prauserella flavalba]
MRTYDHATRSHVLEAIERITRAEGAASGPLEAPVIRRMLRSRPTIDDEEPTRRVAAAFADHIGETHTIDLQTASEDLSLISRPFGARFTYWSFGNTTPPKTPKPRSAAPWPVTSRPTGTPGSPASSHAGHRS